LTAADFHAYNPQFRLWLEEERRQLFFDLPREEAHRCVVAGESLLVAHAVPLATAARESIGRCSTPLFCVFVSVFDPQAL
jgi:hypothetical protein